MTVILWMPLGVRADCKRTRRKHPGVAEILYILIGISYYMDTYVYTFINTFHFTLNVNEFYCMYILLQIRKWKIHFLVSSNTDWLESPFYVISLWNSSWQKRHHVQYCWFIARVLLVYLSVKRFTENLS